MITFGSLLITNQPESSLNQLVKRGSLIQLTEGVYTKTLFSPLSKKLVPCKPLRELAIDYLTYLGIETVPSSYNVAYNEGKTTQVPTG